MSENDPNNLPNQASGIPGASGEPIQEENAGTSPTRGRMCPKSQDGAVLEDTLSPQETWFKADLETPLELFLEVICRTGLFGTALSVFIFIEEDAHPSKTWIPIIFFAAMAAIFWKLRSATDCYYLLDPTKKEIAYHFRFFGLESLTTFLKRDEILGISPGGTVIMGKQTCRIEYRIYVLTRDRQLLHLSDFSLDLDYLNKKAARIARELETEFTPCPAGGILRIAEIPGGALPRHDVSPVYNDSMMEFLYQGFFLIKWGFIIFGALFLMVYGEDALGISSSKGPPDLIGTLSFFSFISAFLALVFTVKFD